VFSSKHRQQREGGSWIRTRVIRTNADLVWVPKKKENVGIKM
jgi:hypothetical protein